MRRSRALFWFLAATAVAQALAACSAGGGASQVESSGPPLPMSTGDLGPIETPNTQGLKVGAQVGSLAPNFRLESPDGGAIALSDLRGKPVLLNFWATWCGPCRSEMPELQKTHQKMSEKLTILGMDVDETKAQVTAFRSELGVSFPMVIDKGQKGFNQYAPFGLPSTYLIDKVGVVRAVKFGPFTDEKDIAKSLEKVGL